MSHPGGPPPEVREKIRSHFSVPTEQQNQQWDKLWQDDFVPWDKGLASPSLTDLLASSHATELLPHPGTKVLIPGCGRGYDVAVFAGHGASAVGMDYSAKAVEEARSWLKTQTVEGEGEMSVVRGDFFEAGFGEDAEMRELEGTWELVYDYTFFCALPPTRRQDWARRMSELLKVGGLLLCLEFPLEKPIELEGPPWGVTKEVYEEVLGKVGFERVWREEPEKMHVQGGNDHLSLWRKTAPSSPKS